MNAHHQAKPRAFCENVQTFFLWAKMFFLWKTLQKPDFFTGKLLLVGKKILVGGFNPFEKY